MQCDKHPPTLEEHLLRGYFFPDIREKGKVIKGFKLLNEEHSVCWKCSSLFCPQDITGRLESLAFAAFDGFAKVVTDIIGTYHQRPYPSAQLQRTIYFFLDPFKDSKLSPLMRIAQTIYILGRNVLAPFENMKSCQMELISDITKIVFRQHLFDPLEYVSHGFDHSLNVADIAITVLAERSVKESMEKKFGKSQFFNAQPFDALVELLAYLHDCGYPHLHERAKANHAMYSADLLDRLGTKLNKFFDNGVYAALRKAIFTHNADEKSDTFTAKHVTQSGDFLSDSDHRHCAVVKSFFSVPEHELRTPREVVNTTNGNHFGRKLDLFLPKDGLIGSELTPAVLSLDPLSFIIRIADNLDFSFYRFNWLQKERAFKDLCFVRHQLFYMKERKSQLTKRKEDFRKLQTNVKTENSKAICIRSIEIIDRILSRLDSCIVFYERQHLVLLENPILRDIERRVNEFSFRHFAGCEAIIKLTNFDIVPNDSKGNHGITIITIKMDHKQYNELNKYIIDEKGRIIAPPHYQLYRTWIAFHQIFTSTLPVGVKPNEEKSYADSLANGLCFKIIFSEERSLTYKPHDLYMPHMNN